MKDLSLNERYSTIRAQTEALTATLETEDFVVSSMTDVSPSKWHLAHTSWFFETFVLVPHLPGYTRLDERYAFLFNSYYVQAGERHCRAQRGLVTRPTVDEVFAYRAHVDEAMQRLLLLLADDEAHPATRIVVLGLHHEQQHQELMLTDIKHVFWTNPLRPALAPRPATDKVAAAPLRWLPFSEGIYQIGHEPAPPGSPATYETFAFDNEGPRHRVFLEGFRLASRLVTNAEYLDFIEDGGYRRANLWLSNGFATVQNEGWQAPLYWEKTADGMTEFTLAGNLPLDPYEPVSHLSYYEADAFARWAGARLPAEAEWEVAASGVDLRGGHFSETGRYHPGPAIADAGLDQLYGELWQWTQSPYVAYPGFRPEEGAIGEYNGKFMCDQWVLRGASCATPQAHARLTYRNFFPSNARWQFTGLRLAAQP